MGADTNADLVAFLRARLEEDEQIARAATPGPWAWTPEKDVWDQNGPTLIRKGTDAPDAELVEVAAGWGHDAWGIYISDADQAHIAAHDPARVLREIEAKRRLVERYERALENRRAHPDDLASAGALLALHGTVKVLAMPYADHPDYRDEWRPTS